MKNDVEKHSLPQLSDTQTNIKANTETTATSKRRALKTLVIAGAAVTVMPRQWKTPLINSVVLPAHAQATTMCPTLTVGNSTFGPGSAAGTCGLTFEFLASDASQALDIISVTNTAPVGTDAVSYSAGTSGSATDTAGLAVSWVGQAVGAPFACATDAPVPVNEITFTVTYNCSSDATIQTMDFSLQAIAAGL